MIKSSFIYPYTTAQYMNSLRKEQKKIWGNPGLVIKNSSQSMGNNKKYMFWMPIGYFYILDSLKWT